MPEDHLNAVQAAPQGLDRYKAATAALHDLEHLAGQLRAIRDVELRELCKQHGPLKTSELTGAPLGTVKAANRPHNDRGRQQ